jgi:tetratricopeptide (TPR) repeat protein
VAQQGFDLVQGDPATAARLLRAALDDPAARDEDRVIALWGLGRLLHNDGSYEAALGSFADALALAAVLGRHDTVAAIRISAAVTHQTVGDAERALAELDLAEADVDAAAAGRWAGQRALVLLYLGRPRDAARDFDRAVTELQRHGDRVALARTLVNRSVAHSRLTRFDAARRDLETAVDVARAVGEHLVAAGALHNLGYLDGRLGRYPAALRAFDAAREEYVRLGRPARLVTALDVDHCDVLLAVGLAAEALDVADRVIAGLDNGDQLQLGEARLVRARAIAMSGDAAAAAAEADELEQLLRAHGRDSWAAVAGHLGVVARAAATTLEVEHLDRLEALAAELDRHGWSVEAAEVRIVHGRFAIQRGDRVTASRQLRRAALVRRGASVGMRAQAALARALVALADDDRRSARAAVRAGLDAIDAQRRTFGSTELRVAASAVAGPLVDLAVGIARRDGDAAGVLHWSERGRAHALVSRAAPDHTDGELVGDLASLRELHVARRRGQLVDADIAALERRIAERRRRADAVDAGRPRFTVGALRAHLGSEELVSYVEHDGDLLAVVADRRSTRLVELGRCADVADAVEHLVFALRRLAHLGRHHPMAGRALQGFRAAADDVERRAMTPLGLRGRTVVVVPTGCLHALPWLGLAAMRCSGSASAR